MNSEGLESLAKTWVNRQCDLSDHWPLMGRVRYPLKMNNMLLDSFKLPSFKVKSIRENSQGIANHNLWEVLRDHMEATDDQTHFPRFFDLTTMDVAKDMGVLKEEGSGSGKPQTYKLSRSAKRKIKNRRKKYSDWTRQQHPTHGDDLWLEYKSAKEEAKSEIKKDTKKSWDAHILEGSKNYTNNEFKHFWNWANKLSGRKIYSNANLNGPVWVKEGNRKILKFGTGATQAWYDHFSHLFEDHTGHSKDREYWEEKFPGEPEESLPRMDDDITWEELNFTLRDLHLWKASFGAPYEFFRTAYDSVADGLFNPEKPNTVLGEVLLMLINKIFNEGVPNQFNKTGLITIPKEGDAKDMDNSRGIVLIHSIIKIITIIVHKRIQPALEERNFFIKEQAGFRKREECVGQATALYEILLRRKLSGKKTFLAFIDFRKAYDTVPHEGLRRKLILAGVSGKCLTFVSSLYENVTMFIRNGKQGYMKMEVLVLRGCRQGCPLSPLCFNIFINDILKDLKGKGVSVNGLKHRIVGLLFADDLALLSPTRRKLREALACLNQSAEKNEMTFGIKKCGIMGVGDNAMALVRADAALWVLGGEQIPVVDNYKYLGLVITSTLDLDEMVLSRMVKGEKAFKSLYPIMSTSRIPLYIRKTIMSACLVPVLTYGGELWGMNEERSKGLQKILTKGLKALLRLKARSNITAASTMGLELKVPSIGAMASAAKTRALLKYPSNKTIISKLVRRPPSGLKKRTWVSGGFQWLKTYNRNVPLYSSPESGARRVRKTQTKREIERGKSTKSLQIFKNCKYAKTRNYLKKAMRFPSVSRGVHWLARCRVNAFWTTVRLAKIGMVAPEWENVCPCCGIDYPTKGETVAHMLLVCPKWNTQRQQHLQSLLDFIQEASGFESWDSLTDAELEVYCQICLGGCKDGVPKLVIPDWSGDEYDGADEVERVVHPVFPFQGPPFIKVARFLQDIVPIRLGILHDILIPSGADADIGMAAFANPPMGLQATDGT